jgi:hypothetical protein
MVKLQTHTPNQAYLENCILSRPTRDQFRDLSTHKAKIDYSHGAIVHNKRSHRWEWDPFSSDPFRWDGKVNYEAHASKKYHPKAHTPVKGKGKSEKGKGFPHQSNPRLLPIDRSTSHPLNRSSIMGVEGEYGASSFDEAIQHIDLVLIMGHKLSSLLAKVGLTRVT